MIVGGKEVLEGLDIGRVGLHTSRGEHYAVKADLWLPDPTLAAVKHDPFLQDSLHQLDQVPVMLLRGSSEDTDIIVNGDDP